MTTRKRVQCWILCYNKNSDANDWPLECGTAGDKAESLFCFVFHSNELIIYALCNYLICAAGERSSNLRRRFLWPPAARTRFRLAEQFDVNRCETRTEPAWADWRPEKNEPIWWGESICREYSQSTATQPCWMNVSLITCLGPGPKKTWASRKLL